MPAVNPRITVTLKPEVHAVMRRLSALTGNSQSAMVGELLEGSLPLFYRMITVLEAAQKLKAEGMQIPGEFRTNLDSAQARLEEQLGLVLEEFDQVGGPLLDEVEKVNRRSGRAGAESAVSAPARPTRRASAPISNRGVTPHGKTLVKGKGAGRTLGEKSRKTGGKNGQV
jgi:hypothetical protein